jgi:hypothetical protein
VNQPPALHRGWTPFRAALRWTWILLGLVAACPACSWAEETLPEGPQAAPAAVRHRVKIRYTGGSPAAAAIVVRKFVGGEWRERHYIVFPCDPAGGRSGEIGRVEKERDAATGKLVRRDFRTGFVLLAIREEKFHFKRLVRRDDLLYRKGSSVQWVRATRNRYRITYLDARGLLKRKWMRDEKK